MKLIRIIFLAFFLIIVNVSALADVPGPPPPTRATARGASTTAEDPTTTPPPEGLPINKDLPYLIISGLLLGTVIIYRNKTKKASI